MTPPPIQRPRRGRATRALRDLVAETTVLPQQLVMPHFVLPQDAGEEAIETMPGISRYGQADLLRAVEADLALGIRSVLLFGLCDEADKDGQGRAACDPAGAAPRAIRSLKQAFGEALVVISDVCLCGYTNHGHCGLMSGGRIDNDASIARLAEVASAHAEAGADIVAPSDMMDGRVATIRQALDSKGLVDTGVLSYAVKYASSYYGPFRDAAHSAPRQGEGRGEGPEDRQGYQMDLRNTREAVREAQLDVEEGADFLMVKPALAYLDVLASVRAHTTLPLFAYNVSGAYAMVRAAAARGWIDEAAIVREHLLAMRRAGADAVITYHARMALQQGWLT